MSKQHALVAVIFSVISLTLAAAPLPRLSTILEPGILVQVRAEGRQTAISSGQSALSGATWLSPASFAAVRAALEAEKPGLRVEAVFLLARQQPSDPAREMAALLRQLASISTLEGIQYWSASRKTWRTFFAESYRIDSLERRARLPDLMPDGLQPGLGFLAFQRDLSFGSNVYNYEYILRGDASITVTQTNLTPMSYGLIPLLGSGGLRTRILVIPADEGIVFYVASAATVARIPILSGRLEDSFSNRAAAFFSWFEKGFPKGP
ncbi:MAG: DUF6675 family protein [Spirochaetota bacterium]